MAFQVLIVDNHRDVSKAIRSGVQSLGSEFEVATAMSGEEAMLEARLIKFDLLISEVRLTGMSGMELTQKLRARKPDLKVFLISASLDRYIRREVADAHVDALLQKPIEMADLLAHIRRTLGLEGGRQLPLQDEDELVPEPLSISDRLTDLRQELDAPLILLISDTGEILIQAGEQQIDIEAEISSLIAVFSAGHKISRLLGMAIPDNLYTFKGSTHDIVMTHLGENHALLIITYSAGTALEKLDHLNQIVQQGKQDLQTILADMGVSPVVSEEMPSTDMVVSPEDEEELEEIVELDAALDALFSKVDALPETDVDSFWEVATAEDTGIFISADALSYEQARQLGLTPEEE